MSAWHADLVVIWYLLLGFVLVLALLLDGFSLGVGVLSLFVGQEDERALMLGSVGRIWHANQTWLVVLGAILFGAFPLAYGLVLSLLYLPVALMLLGFIFRGVSVEYYGRAQNKRLWGLFFGLGSLAAALAQGLALGGLLGGLPLMGERFAGSAWVWLRPFSLLAALCVLGAFALAGSAWLIVKTTGGLQEKARHAGRAAGFFLILAGPALIIWARALHPFISRHWLAWPGLLFTSLPLALSALCLLGFVVCIARHWELGSLLTAWGALLFALAGLAASLYPTLVPPGLSAFRAASGTLNLEFMLVGFGLFLPVMLAYNAYQYWVFRGKADKYYD